MNRTKNAEKQRTAILGKIPNWKARMRQFSLTGVLLLAASTSLFADNASGTNPPLSREFYEWCDLWMPHFTENKLPRVLLIGDSITRGYSGEVDKRLEGKAYVSRLADSHFLNDPMLLTEIAMVLDNQKFDVIHFNNGMHGWQYSEDDYRKYFPAYLEVIRKHAPNAKLIWATTTPLKVDNKVPPGSMQVSNARVAARNAIALTFIAPLGIPVDDLYALVANHPEYHDSDVTHFNDKGVNVQAAQVAAEIQKLLPR